MTIEELAEKARETLQDANLNNNDLQPGRVLDYGGVTC